MSERKYTHIAHAYGAGDTPPDSLHLYIADKSLDQFRNILQRALNCAPPHEEQYKDWFALAEMLEGRVEVKGVQNV